MTNAATLLTRARQNRLNALAHRAARDPKLDLGSKLDLRAALAALIEAPAQHRQIQARPAAMTANLNAAPAAMPRFVSRRQMDLIRA